MTNIVLDAELLGMISNPKHSHENNLCLLWVLRLLSKKIKVCVSEIADYEVRRELLKTNRIKAIGRLDKIKKELFYLPLTTDVMSEAAKLWARTKQKESTNVSLDCDVILAAQTTCCNGILATTHTNYFSKYTTAKLWKEISVDQYGNIVSDVEYFDNVAELFEQTIFHLRLVEEANNVIENAFLKINELSVRYSQRLDELDSMFGFVKSLSDHKKFSKSREKLKNESTDKLTKLAEEIAKQTPKVEEHHKKAISSSVCFTQLTQLQTDEYYLHLNYILKQFQSEKKLAQGCFDIFNNASHLEEPKFELLRKKFVYAFQLFIESLDSRIKSTEEAIRLISRVSVDFLEI
ncbi:MAG: hypothetical protein FD167_4821 [bacterium]|nr:MAG: hypothetical protein FD167_4821 [bacterium]